MVGVPATGCQPMRERLRNIWREFIHDLCPPVCQLCGGAALSADICAGCLRDLPRPGRVCSLCAAGLPRGRVCGECLRRPPAWDLAVAPFRYAFPVDRLLQRLKYQGRLEHGRLLGLLLARAVRRGPRPDRIAPVPLHLERWRERGFNQAAELARPLARRLGVPLDERLVWRRRATPPLWRLGPADRRRLLAGAFEARRDLTGLRIAVVDDVLTSGATADAIARELRRAGAVRVEIWAVARASGPRAGVQAPAKT
jgi:ComF family protein